MSFETANRVWKLRVDIPGIAKSILARLAAMTNGNDICWPSYSTLAKDTGFERSTVIRNVKYLCDNGYLEKMPGNEGFSNRYRVVLEPKTGSGRQTLGSSGEPPPGSREQLGGSTLLPTSSREQPEYISNTSKNKTTTPLPPKTPKPKPETPPPPDTEGQVPAKEKKIKKTTAPGFDDFWKAYPRKVAKHAAEKAWLKKRPELDAVLKAIKAQSQPGGPLSPEKKEYHPHPATWLNAGRWLDEAETQTEGPKIEPTNFDF